MKSAFECVNLKKKRVGYSSVMSLEGWLASQEICDLFAKIIDWMYASDPWKLSDLGPDFVNREPFFGFFEYAVSDIKIALLEIDSGRRRILKNFASALPLPLCLLFDKSFFSCIS
jgi:hypothetical protein